MMSRIARAARGGDEGLTLSELIVGMALTALALAMIGGFFASIMRSVAAGRAVRAGTSIAANATGELSRVIRTASSNATASGTSAAVVAGTATTLTVTAYVDADPQDPAPTQCSFAVNAAGNLIETRVAAQRSNGYWDFTNGATTRRTIPGPILTTTPIFTYRDSEGAVVAPGATGLTAAQSASVTSITITITAKPGTAEPVQLTTTAVMTNLTLS